MVPLGRQPGLFFSSIEMDSLADADDEDVVCWSKRSSEALVRIISFFGRHRVIYWTLIRS